MVAQTLFERTCDVHRMRTVAGQTPGVGDVGYSGPDQTTTPTDTEGEDVLYTGVSCAISSRAAGRTKNSLLAADIVYRPTWSIVLPPNAVPRNGIRDNDIVIDDDGYRYGVAAAMWSSIGWQLECIRLMP